MSIKTGIATLILAGMLVGCSGPAPDPAAVNASLIIIEFPTGDPLRITGGAVGKVQIREDLSVAVQDGRLLVNDKDYGPCNPGDKVKIEAGNVVKVNDQVRQPGRTP
jgi:hypothetical protein